MSRPRPRRVPEKSRPLARAIGHRPPALRPRGEAVEDRILMATLLVPSQYGSITAAVNYANAHPDPSNTIMVSPGTYREANITISSPMTLESTGTTASNRAIIDGGGGVDPGPGVIDVVSSATTTAGSRVTIQGFTIQDPVQDEADGSRSLVAVSNISIPLTLTGDTLIGGIAGQSNLFDVGVLVDSAQAGAPVTISNNTFQGMWQGVLDQLPLGGSTITGNTFQNLVPSTFTSTASVSSVYEPEGIFALTFGGAADNVTGLSITGNNFKGYDGLGITVSGGYQGQTPSQFIAADISGNVINTVGFAASQFRAGILLIDDSDTAGQEGLGGVVRSTIDSNAITAQVPCATGTRGIWVLGADNNDIFSNNSIVGMDRAIDVEEQVTGAGYASGLTATLSSFVNDNYSIYNPSPNLVNAPSNYYGAVGATAVKAQANGGVNVDYNPWLGDGTDTDPGVTGFQPNLTPADTDVIRISGTDSVRVNQPYTLTIQQTGTDPSGNLGSGLTYTVNWGDGSTSAVTFGPGVTSTTAMHTYTTASSTPYTISATVMNGQGNTFQVASTVGVKVVSLSSLVVTSFTPTSSGFAVRFDAPINTGVLNLYSGIDNSGVVHTDAPDVTLVGASTGPVFGSIKLDADGKGFTFLQTGPALPADTYTVTLVSGANAIVDTAGHPLDGTMTGSTTTGSNYTTTFTVAPSSPPTLSLPDFARGPGQPVVVPADPSLGSLGLPITISNGSGVTSIMFVLTYDPTLLSITSQSLTAAAAAAAPGAQYVFNASIPGRLSVCISAPGGLASGAQTLMTLTASVPSNAPYRSKDLLQLRVTSVNGTAVTAGADQALGVVDYLGDATGNGGYSGLDSSDIRRVVANIDSGFQSFPLVDPVIIGDVSANGGLSGLDASLVEAYVANEDVPQIPADPGPPSNFATGPDPLVSIPKTLSGAVGSTITVPVNILQTNDAPVGLSSVDLIISYDPSVFRVSNVRLGGLSAGLELTATVDAKDGFIYATESSTGPEKLTPGEFGQLLEMDFTILSNAGSPAINLRATSLSGNLSTSLNEGNLVLVPAPTNGSSDPVDGLVAITTPPSRPGNRTPIIVPASPVAAPLVASLAPASPVVVPLVTPLTPAATGPAVDREDVSPPRIRVAEITPTTLARRVATKRINVGQVVATGVDLA